MLYYLQSAPAASDGAKRKRPQSTQSQGNKAARLTRGNNQVVDFEDESDEEGDGDGISVMTPQEEKNLKSCLLETLLVSLLFALPRFRCMGAWGGGGGVGAVKVLWRCQSEHCCYMLKFLGEALTENCKI